RHGRFGREPEPSAGRGHAPGLAGRARPPPRPRAARRGTRPPGRQGPPRRPPCPAPVNGRTPAMEADIPPISVGTIVILQERSRSAGAAWTDPRCTAPPRAGTVSFRGET